MTQLMRVLVYKSVATDLFDLDRIDDLCHQAIIFNNSKDITGLLIYHEKIFFQWIEGAEDDIFLLYEKLKKDPRHHYLREILYTTSASRQFKSWGMKAIYSNMSISSIPGVDGFDFDELIAASDKQVINKFISLAHHLSE
jgi:Sensors of blue-light using FAD